MNNHDLILQKLALECIGVDEENHLKQIDGSTCDDVEKLVIFKAPKEYPFHFWNMEELARHANVTPYIGGFSTERLLKEEKALASLLNPSEVRKETWYYFPADYYWGRNYYVKHESFVAGLDYQFDDCSLMRDGKYVARAWSVRQNERAAEVAVEVDEDYRRQGLGKACVKEWVYQILRQGKIPLYAHRPNMQSQKLAESLGALKIADVVSYQ